MASPSFSSSPYFSPSSLFPPRTPPFTPIPEHEKDDDDDPDAADSITPYQEQQPQPPATAAAGTSPYHHHPTPLHPTPSSSHRSTSTIASVVKKKKKKKKKPSNDVPDHVVSCSKCRPSAREKISVVPLDTQGRPSSSLPSPSSATNGVLKLLSSLTRKSVRPPAASSDAVAVQPTDRPRPTSRDVEEWRMAATELSRKLLHTTRKRDEAVLEASRLKQSMAELEKKLTRLESYCHDLKKDLDRCTVKAGAGAVPPRPGILPSFPLDAFLRAVSQARTMVRHLSRSLTTQIRSAGPSKSLDRISLLFLQAHDVRLPSSNPKTLVFYLEALLNRVFHEDFESSGFDRGGPDGVLDPYARSESNRVAYEALKGLAWEEVLSKGTRHFSEGLSRFCDRRMSEVVAMLGWARAWPEPLLQAFFGAAKGVWLVHLLAWSVHPAVPVFRVGAGARFDPGYMEEVGPAADRGRGKGGPVRMMVAPGFYLGGSVVKCKVLCAYEGHSEVDGHEVHGVLTTT